MEFKQLRVGKIDELRSRFSVDTNLPINRAEPREVIAVRSFDPWQAHASVNFARFTFTYTQEAAAVIDVDLRQYF